MTLNNVSRFQLAPAQTRIVRGEQLSLSAEAPHSYSRGTRLRELQTIAPGVGTTARGSLIFNRVRVRTADRVLHEGRDYLLEHDWGTLGLAPNSSLTPNDIVAVDYEYSLLRLDSLVRTAHGEEVVREGISHLTAPCPPELKSGETRLANFLVPYHSDGRNIEIFPVLESAQQATTLSTAGRIPKTMARLRYGQPVKIVCWGDSVTDGGDASTPEYRFTSVFEKQLKARFPQSQIAVKTIAVGGSQSRQWLDPITHPFPSPDKQMAGCFARIAAEQPDLVTVEFVNDAWLEATEFEEIYAEILRRLRAIDAEVIFITPHFTMPEMMEFTSLRDAEKRPYVLALREFTARHNIALADASSRWQHLWREGLPYTTLLQNGINHPDDRGHAIFAEELMKCFAPAQALLRIPEIELSEPALAPIGMPCAERVLQT